MFNSSASSVGDGGRRTPSQTSSAIIAETVSGSHVLKVDGYSGTTGLGNGKSIRSGTFDVGGHLWSIIYYPDGSDSDVVDWISLALSLHHTAAKEVSAKFKIWLLDQDGKPVPSYSYSVDSQVRTFSSKVRQWGLAKFIKRKDLEKSVCLRDDSFSVRFDVTVTKEILTEATTRQFVAVPPSDMHRHLGQLLTAGEGADVTFEVAGETFAAHRCVLAARSSVFKAELLGPMKEKTMSRIQIRDMEAKVFEAMLHFIYTDSLRDIIDEGETVEMAQHLLVAADRYNLERLKLFCEDMLCRYIGTSTVATTLALADQHGCQGLKEACFELIKSPGNLKVVMASDGFEHLNCSSLLKELVAKLAP